MAISLINDSRQNVKVSLAAFALYIFLYIHGRPYAFCGIKAASARYSMNEHSSAHAYRFSSSPYIRLLNLYILRIRFR